jgi:hypothetical protein
LAVAEAGKYRVRVNVRVPVRGVTPELDIPSNPVDVEFIKPEGREAEVFAQMQDRGFVEFLHFGRPPNGEPELRRALELTEKFPASAYRPALRRALRSGFRFVRNRLADDLADRIKAAAGFQEALYFDDKRLDRKLVPAWTMPTTAKTVVETLARQTGIPLEITPELAGVELHGIWPETSVRVHMDRLDMKAIAYWFPKGDGYILAPIDYEPPAKK